jgi:MoaA/NifB/PqqE/SkfB family radical SAM enzyme
MKKLKYSLKLEDLNANSLSKITLLLSQRCLFKCDFCHNWKAKDNFNSLKTKQILSLLDQIKKIKNKYSNQNNNKAEKIKIILGSDGMIEINEKLIQIIKKCKENNFSVLINTNAFLINRLTFDQLLYLGVDKFSISLDFLNKEKQNIFRGMNNSYEHIFNLINHIKKTNNIDKIGINTIIMKPNQDEIIELIKYVKKIGTHINFQAISQPFNTPLKKNWFKDKKFNSLWPDNNIYSLIDKIILLKEKNYPIGNNIDQLNLFKEYFKNPNIRLGGVCKVPNLGIEIDSVGNLRVCPYMNPVDNIKNTDLEQVLSDKKFFDTIKNMYKCDKNCMQMVNCSYDKIKIKNNCT